MSNIAKMFETLRNEKKKGLITFVTAGDPDLATTVLLVKGMVNAGADLVELGIPYSDPIAEGPVIQAANGRALKHNIRLNDVFASVRTLRKSVSVPFVFLLYYNCVVQYGLERFVRECESAGVDGLIIPDLPFEEQGDFKPLCQKHGVDLVTMVAPNSEARIPAIVKQATGFLYCVSSLGVTGMRSNYATDFKKFFKSISRHSSLPKALGFGVSGPEQVRELKQYCDAIIVGSAIVKRIGESPSKEAAVKRVVKFTRELRKALD